MIRLLSCTLVLMLSLPLQGADEEVDRLSIYQFALYLLPGTEGDPAKTLEELVATKYADFTIISDVDGPPTRPLIIPALVDDVESVYPPPDMQLIGYFGRGLSREQALALQDSQRVLVIDFGYPSNLTPTALPNAIELMADLATKHGGLIWDETTREVFSAEAWRESRVDTWKDGVPSVPDHTTIHAYRNGDFVRAITLGMVKFGQPDIVVNDFSWSSSESVGSLINLVTQTLVEGGEFDDEFALVVDVEALQHELVREILQAGVIDGAELKAELKFRPEVPQDGDPDNFILEIRFDSGSGQSPQEQQELLLSKVFGSEDFFAYVDHDAEILAASEAAKAKLPELRRDFNNGLEPGESIFVKAPFETIDGGNEWMWVEIIEWKGSSIRGLLQNDPVHVPALRVGSEVTVKMDEIFDYIREYSDGTREGNETGRIMQNQLQ